MDQHSVKIVLHNDRNEVHAFVIEVWGEEYALLPGEKATLWAFSDDSVPWFEIQENDRWTAVYCEKASDFKMMQGDRQLTCGHQMDLHRPT